MRKRSASFILFLTCFLYLCVTGFSADSGSSNLNVSLSLQEWLVLEIRTPQEAISASGNMSCGVNLRLDSQTTVVDIHVLLSVARDQEVELRAMPLGPLVSPQGGITPISQIAWTCSGAGFTDGALDEGHPQIMAHWTGPGQYSGRIQYVFPDKLKKGDYSQVITYSLYTL